MAHKKSIDVVIPTLNGSEISKTINSLNFGKIRPKNIYCIYYKKFNFKEFQKFKNITFKKSKKKGQIDQRNLGIKKCKSDLILQLDDDIVLEKNTLLSLINSHKICGENSVVGPAFYDHHKNYIYNINDNFFTNLYKLIICGAPYGIKKSGKVTSLTLAYGVATNTKDKLKKTDWLPGGCTLCSKKIALINFKKFPFKGKAYCEDIYYSILRKNRKIQHFVNLKAKVMTQRSINSNNLDEFFNEIKIRKFLLNLTKGNKYLFFNWVSFEFLNRFFLKKLIS